VCYNDRVPQGSYSTMSVLPDSDCASEDLSCVRTQAKEEKEMRNVFLTIAAIVILIFVIVIVGGLSYLLATGSLLTWIEFFHDLLRWYFPSIP